MKLNVKYICKPQTADLFLKEASEIVPTILQEKGCLDYTYYQGYGNKDLILLTEAWESEELQQVHLQQEHMKKIQEIKTKYVLETEVVKF